MLPRTGTLLCFGSSRPRQRRPRKQTRREGLVRAQGRNCTISGLRGTLPVSGNTHQKAVSWPARNGADPAANLARMRNWRGQASSPESAVRTGSKGVPLSISQPGASIRDRACCPRHRACCPGLSGGPQPEPPGGRIPAAAGNAPPTARVRVLAAAREPPAGIRVSGQAPAAGSGVFGAARSACAVRSECTGARGGFCRPARPHHGFCQGNA